MARQRIANTATNTRDHMLLATKLFIPAPTSTLVERPRLTALLTAGARRAATLVSAPAGWGKTTLLSSWHAGLSCSGYSFAWVSLDADDNDPVRFWSYILVALNTIHEGVSDAALSMLRSLQPPPMELILTSLLNALTTLSTDTVLVLDDYHVIEAQPIHHSLTFLIEHLPPRFNLVITTRFDPPLPLARLRARGALTEIRAIDLRFTHEEAAAFLTEIMGLPLTAEQVSALEERTEGWIVGLQLAALSAQGRPTESMEKFVKAFMGSNRYVVEYLAEEVLWRQTDETQTFLLRTSVLDRMCAPLCDTVLTMEQGEDSSNQTLGAHIHLEHLERANLFLISLDDEKNWYRYHHLFADVLRSRLQQTQPRLVPELHRRASIWYERHEMLSEAVQHALAASNFERAADLIEQSYHTIAVRGQVRMVLSWLNRLPDQLVRTRPLLCIYQADMLMHTMQLEAAEARLQDAERCLKADMSEDQMRTILGLVAALRAILVRFHGDFDSCVDLAYQALKILPETVNFGRASAMVSAAHAFLMNGDVTPASVGQLMTMLAPARASSDLYVVLRSFALLARQQVLQGHLMQAATTYEEVVRVVPEPKVLRALSSGAAYYFGLGDILREWNKLDDASRYLIEGMDMVGGTQTVFADDLTLGYIAQARLQQARGEYGKAISTMDTFAQLAHQRNFVPHLVARGFAVRAQVELARGNLAEAIHWAETSGLSTTDDNRIYPREWEYLTLARVYIAQGRDDPESHFLLDALNLLNRLLQDAEAKARIYSALEIAILRALALDAQDDHQGAQIALERAVMLAEPEGYMRIFLDEGEPMLTLLSKLYTNGHCASNYIQTLLVAGNFRGREQTALLYRSKEPHSGPYLSLLDPLSERELEVLHLVANGDSNYEIAEQLVVTVSTVKRHVSNIFSKLEVTNRTQAAARAREFGML
jgi:LuxR family transcriptional regulator, maltose regulon positive regulatory protein